MTNEKISEIIGSLTNVFNLTYPIFVESPDSFTIKISEDDTVKVKYSLNMYHVSMLNSFGEKTNVDHAMYDVDLAMSYILTVILGLPEV